MTIYCENCNQIHQGTYGSGRFCSIKCACSYSTKNKRKEINAKVSKALSGRPSPSKGRRLKERFITNCIICNAEVEVIDKLKETTCKSLECTIKKRSNTRKANKKQRQTFITKCYICNAEVETFDKQKRTTCKSAECIRKQKILAGKKSASKRKKRSKDEIKLHKLCERYYHKVFHNIPIANGWDADIILPDYKIAIMWNGPWHYRDMSMKNHSLSQVVNRDIIKIMEFEKIGWEVLIYEDNQWSPQTAFIDIILRLTRDKENDLFLDWC